jgi:hypothetical protein
MREYKHWIDKGYNDVILTKENKWTKIEWRWFQMGYKTED